MGSNRYVLQSSLTVSGNPARYSYLLAYTRACALSYDDDLAFSGKATTALLKKM